MTQDDHTTIALSTLIKCLMLIASVTYGSSVLGCESEGTGNISSMKGTPEIEQAKLHVQMHIEYNVDESCHEECCTESCDCSHGNCFTIWLLTGNYHYKIKSFDYVFSLFEGDLLRSPPSRLLRPPIA